MKKLVTIAKSKFYMLKVSYPDVVEQVMTDMVESGSQEQVPDSDTVGQDKAKEDTSSSP